MRYAVITGGILVTLLAGAHAKDGPTFYTPKRVAVARQNVTEHEWALQRKEFILKKGDPIRYYDGQGKLTAAEQFAAQSDEFIWLLQPDTRIPRVIPQERRATCPVHGDKVKKYSVWCPYTIDPIGHPYQIQCMMGKEWYPSNKYHEGDMTSGEFPDDGNGILHKGKRYYALREYAHMVYGSVVIASLRSLSQAYLLTDDPKFARKGCILLARLATQYPNYGWPEGSKLENRFDRTYLGPWNNRHPHYDWKKGGMITDLIWESFCLEDTAYAYDALYDYMDKDPEMVAFLKRKGMPIETGDDLRRYVETYIFRAAMRALQTGMIHGNEGFHQAAALAVALVMDDYGDTHPNSKDMVDYAYHGIGYAAYILTNGLTRDGGGHESPNYNLIKLDFIRVARLMEEVRKRHPKTFPADRYPDLFAGPKARAMFDFNIDIVCNDNAYPSIGDGGGIDRPGRRDHRVHSFVRHQNLYALRRYGDPRFARACVDIDGTPYTGELCEPYPQEQIQTALADPESRIVRKSRLLDGYGVAILESGEWPKRRTAMLNYTSLLGHRQRDQLSLQLFARGVAFLPDLGYPKTWDYRQQYDANSLAHNTVTVDETRPRAGLGGTGRLFYSGNGVHIITAHHDPYPPGARLGKEDARAVDLYERTVVMVDVAEDQFYVVDLFAVNGGEQHDQSWHAMQVEPEAPNLDWKAQGRGTLAGPDVPQFGAYTDRWGRRNDKGDFPSYLTDIRRATLDKPAVWVWKSGLPEGDTLRLHVVPLEGPAEVIMGKGRSPVRADLDYLLVRRRVRDGSASYFLTVLDACQGNPVVRRVRVEGSKPIRLEVERADGVDTIVLNVPDSPSRTTAPRSIGVLVRSREGDREVRRVEIGDVPSPRGGRSVKLYQTRVQSLDYENSGIAVRYSSKWEERLQGRTIRVYNADRSALFRVVKTRRAGRRLWLSLDHTPLVARGPVKGLGEGRLTLDAHLTFAASFAGAWLGEGRSAVQVKSATGQGEITLKKKAPARTLSRLYKSKVVSVWQYGIGDRVEVPPSVTE